ncbi:kinase-like domain-containing protein [Aspergillus californicus]
MDFDDLTLAHFDGVQNEWAKLCSSSGAAVADLADHYRKRDDCLLLSMHCGSFNFSFRCHWEDGGEDWLLRFAIPGKSMFQDEKVYREAVLMDYIAKETAIPVPKVICHGTAADNPTGLGPFIIMTWAEGRKMSDVLREENDPKVDTLNPAIDLILLKRLYGEMANVLLELWKLNFDKIGSLGAGIPGGKPGIDGRPLTQEMNESIRTTGVTDYFPRRTYQSSADYFVSLLELQSIHLRQQRNSVYNAQDCRDKYVCRQLMKAIALDFIPKSDYGPFKLFCDDLSPQNVLVNDSLEITAVIDWEFCYAAPSQFAASIPWWLLLKCPSSMVNETGPGPFFDAFLPKANIFLEALEEREQSRESEGSTQLSARMRSSIEDRSAWFTLACRRALSVDLVYWDLLDEFCWGPRKSIDDRNHTFTGTGEMHKGREDFIRLKLQQLREYKKEVGEETEISYEPPPSLPPTPVLHDKPSYSYSSNGYIFGGLVTGLAVGLGVTLFLNPYRR